MTMRALVKHPGEVGFRLEEVPTPEPGPDEVLIQVHTTGICGTDLHIYQWDDWAKETSPTPQLCTQIGWGVSAERESDSI